MLKRKLKLSALSEALLKDKEMSTIFGGGDSRYCTCSCAYEGLPGGASAEDNRAANYNLGNYGGYSTTGCNQYYMSSTSGAYGSDPALVKEGV
ncbi:MAG: TIGR04149 family rSAM-modified RiPP [Bacteroidaceae bacterium]|nr:TIGR04149 family rSAM-modified RiPP [Bacteroidaceae bacterium]